MILGYYLFLGNGDYHNKDTVNKQWTSTWLYSDWVKFIDSISDLNIKKILIYLNGHRLPYLSKVYPELIDNNCNIVKNNFHVELFEYISKKKIEIVAVFTTTGHAGGYSELFPSLKIIHQQKVNNIEDTLISFPKHLREGKLSKKDGAAQLGFGVLCHNNPLSRVYPENIINELIFLYGKYFDGIALHPPESAYGCYCEYCNKKFTQEKNLDINKVSFYKARKFFITSYLKFQEELILKITNKTQKKLKIYSFTIPWFFEINLNSISKIISKNITLIDWDYNLSKKRIIDFVERLKKYHENGYNVIFMPTSGFSFNPKINTEIQIDRVNFQIESAIKNNVEEIIYFIGPKLNEYVFKVSPYKCDQKKYIKN